MFSFKYSPRPNTLAEQAAAPTMCRRTEKTRRIVALQALQREIQSELNERAGRARRSTSWSTRRAGGATRSCRAARRSNVVVNLPGPAEWIGRTVPVRIERAGPHSVWGRSAIDSRRVAAPRLVGSHANRDDDQGADGRPDHEHADRHPARQGRAAGAADLGRDLRGQRHRAADREHRDAAADDARPAAQRHPGPQGVGRRRSSSATCRRTRSTR